MPKAADNAVICTTGWWWFSRCENVQGGTPRAARSSAACSGATDGTRTHVVLAVCRPLRRGRTSRSARSSTIGTLARCACHQWQKIRWAQGTFLPLRSIGWRGAATASQASGEVSRYTHSHRETPSAVRRIILFYARPHPDPLPRGEGTAAVHVVKSRLPESSFPSSVSDLRTASSGGPVNMFCRKWVDLLAGVTTLKSVQTDFSVKAMQ
jgi:hypothetical protein